MGKNVHCVNLASYSSKTDGDTTQGICYITKGEILSQDIKKIFGHTSLELIWIQKEIHTFLVGGL